MGKIAEKETKIKKSDKYNNHIERRKYTKIPIVTLTSDWRTTKIFNYYKIFFFCGFTSNLKHFWTLFL